MIREYAGQIRSAREVARSRLEEQDARVFPASIVWRAESFRESNGLPMPLRRAHALNAVLERCDLIRIPGELLLGSGHARFARTGDAEELACAREVLTPIGARHFGTHADHAAPDYPSFLREGLPGLRSRVAAKLRSMPTSDPRFPFVESMLLAVDGLSRHFLRWADYAEQSAQGSPLLRRQASMLRDLTARPPHGLWEALQLVYLTHCAFQLDDRYAMALGRADQYLVPFYRKDVDAGRLTRDEAAVLLEHFVAKLADRGDIQNVCVGGLTPDGGDAVNEVSYLIVDAVKAVARPGANLTARISRQTPQDFVLACADCIRQGSGFPAVYNDEVQVPALMKHGYPPEAARDYCFVGCIEAFIPGKQAPWADSRFNLLRCVQDVVDDESAELHTWQDFMAAWKERVRRGVERHVADVISMEKDADDRCQEYTSPLLSTLTADCIERGLDVNCGGARYPANHGIAGMGIGSTADALMAVKRFVYDTGTYDLPTLRSILRANFAGYEEDRALLLRGAPKYGNDQEEVDALAAEAAEVFCQEVLRHRTNSGGFFWPLMAANIQNVAAGREVGATPDGRLAGQPVSDAASPSFGRDTHGPTAVIRSISRVDYSLAPGGNVVNMKLHPGAAAGRAGLEALGALIRTCFELGGIQLQFNAIGREVLLDAMEHPERYPDLVVRVSGFSAYFTRLDRAVQEDVLARTEHFAI